MEREIFCCKLFKKSCKNRRQRDVGVGLKSNLSQSLQKGISLPVIAGGIISYE